LSQIPLWLQWETQDLKDLYVKHIYFNTATETSRRQRTSIAYTGKLRPMLQRLCICHHKYFIFSFQIHTQHYCDEGVNVSRSCSES